MKILLGIPEGRDTFKKYFVKSLMELESEAKKDGHELTQFTYANAFIAVARNFICDYAIKNDFDYILWLDTDEYYPKDIIKRLLAHKKDVVGGFYQKRKPPFEPIAYNLNLKFNAKSVNDPKCWVKPDGKLQRIKACGMGGTMVKVSALKKIKEPFFAVVIKDNLHYLGEDLYFYRKLNKAGVKIYCDTGLIYPHQIEAFIKDGQIAMLPE